MSNGIGFNLNSTIGIPGTKNLRSSAKTLSKVVDKKTVWGGSQSIYTSANKKGFQVAKVNNPHQKGNIYIVNDNGFEVKLYDKDKDGNIDEYSYTDLKGNTKTFVNKKGNIEEKKWYKPWTW